MSIARPQKEQGKRTIFILVYKFLIFNVLKKQGRPQRFLKPLRPIVRNSISICLSLIYKLNVYS